jgi:hypothetical protein
MCAKIFLHTLVNFQNEEILEPIFYVTQINLCQVKIYHIRSVRSRFVGMYVCKKKLLSHFTI